MIDKRVVKMRDGGYSRGVGFSKPTPRYAGGPADTMWIASPAYVFINFGQYGFSNLTVNQQLHALETFLLLGANLGDRVTTMSRAVELITQQVGKIIRQSQLYETTPWGVTEQPSYLNQVVLVETSLAPQPLLEHTQAIEYELGRVRLDKWGARLIDIDILYYEQQVIKTETLVVPHPYLHLRRFTLMPLMEIAPDFTHPFLKKNTLELLNECPDTGEVTIFNF